MLTLANDTGGERIAKRILFSRTKYANRHLTTHLPLDIRKPHDDLIHEHIEHQFRTASTTIDI